MNTNNFVRIGNVIINTEEISSVELDAGRQYGPEYSIIVMKNGTQYAVFKNQIKCLFGDMIPEELPSGTFDDSELKEELPSGSFDDSELVKKESLPEGSFDDSEYKDDHYNADGSFNYNNKYGDFPCYE